MIREEPAGFTRVTREGRLHERAVFRVNVSFNSRTGQGEPPIPFRLRVQQRPKPQQPRAIARFDQCQMVLGVGVRPFVAVEWRRDLVSR